MEAFKDEQEASKAELVLVSKDPAVLKRVEGLCVEFQYRYRVFGSLEELAEHPGAYRLVMTDIRAPTARLEAALVEHAQVASQVASGAKVMAVLPGRVDRKDIDFARKNGCDLVMLEEELHTTSKPEFIFTQVIRATYLPVKPGDLSTTGRSILSCITCSRSAENS